MSRIRQGIVAEQAALRTAPAWGADVQDGRNRRPNGTSVGARTVGNATCYRAVTLESYLEPVASHRLILPLKIQGLSFDPDRLVRVQVSHAAHLEVPQGKRGGAGPGLRPCRPGCPEALVRVGLSSMTAA